jgi:hypothetical protein
MRVGLDLRIGVNLQDDWHMRYRFPKSRVAGKRLALSTRVPPTLCLRSWHVRPHRRVRRRSDPRSRDSLGALRKRGTPPVAGAYQPEPGEWARWTHDDKHAWMQKTISPKMHDLLVSVDTPRYGDMSCKTCHGQGAIEGSFAMPNDGLPKLDPSPSGFEKLSRTNPKMFEM